MPYLILPAKMVSPSTPSSISFLSSRALALLLFDSRAAGKPGGNKGPIAGFGRACGAVVALGGFIGLKKRGDR